MPQTNVPMLMPTQHNLPSMQHASQGYAPLMLQHYQPSQPAYQPSQMIYPVMLALMMAMQAMVRPVIYNYLPNFLCSLLSNTKAGNAVSLHSIPFSQGVS
jgi:hypothetical protein